MRSGRISPSEFEALPLSVHRVLEGVPLHDVWAVDLPYEKAGITLHEFLGRSPDRPRASFATRSLLRLRYFLGSCFGWDKAPPESAGSGSTFAERLTEEDRSRSLQSPGSRNGMFQIVYFFENEQLSEIANRTVRAAALQALVETEDRYRLYFAVYVQNVSRWTPLYMALIEPFRRFIVYPSTLASIRASWDGAFGGTAA